MSNWKFTVFLDRDGTICAEGNYISRPEQVVLLPGAVDGLRRMVDLGGCLVVVTNQSGIGRGYYTEKDLEAVNGRLQELLAEHKLAWDALYYCPHFAGGEVKEYDIECNCRKPRPGMIERAREEMDLPSGPAFVIGDRETDLLLGKNTGCRSILVTSGYGAEEAKRVASGEVEADFVAAGLPEAVVWIESQL